MKFIVLVIASLSRAGSFACDANQRGEEINELQVQRNIAAVPEKPENDLVLKTVREDTRPFTTNAPIHEEPSPNVPHGVSQPAHRPLDTATAPEQEGTSPKMIYHAYQPSQTPLDIIRATGPEETSPEVREDASQFAQVPSGLSLPFSRRPVLGGREAVRMPPSTAPAAATR